MWKKKNYITFPKKSYLWVSKFEILWAWKNFERNFFSSSQRMKSQKMVRIMKKDAKFVSKSEQKENAENSEIGYKSETLTH